MVRDNFLARSGSEFEGTCFVGRGWRGLRAEANHLEAPRLILRLLEVRGMTKFQAVSGTLCIAQKAHPSGFMHRNL